MGLVEQSAFVRACRDATPQTVAAFVGALYEARGWAVERADGRRLLASKGGERRRISVLSPDAEPEETADIVVSDRHTIERETVRVLDYDTLYEQLHYAIDRDDAADLLETHLGLAVDPGAIGAGSTQPDGDGTVRREPDRDDEPAVAPDGSSPSGSWLRRGHRGALVFVLAVVLVVVALVSGVPTATGPTASDPGGATDTPAVSSPTPSDPRTATPNTTATSRRTPGPDPVPDSVPVTSEEALVGTPPGVHANGSVDATVLARAHRSVATNTSYTLTLASRAIVDGHVVAAHSERIRVGDHGYSSSVSSVGNGLSLPRIAGEEAYSNGTLAFSRDNGSVRVERSSDADPFLDDTAAFLRGHMATGQATILDSRSADGTTTYRLSIRGRWTPNTAGDAVVVTPSSGVTPAAFPGSSSVRGTVFVTREGLVRFARWSYETPDRDDASVVVTMRVTGINETTVSRPAWVPDDE